MLRNFLYLLILNLEFAIAFPNITVRELPTGVREELVNIFMGALNLINTCNSSDINKINLLLYTQQNPTKPIHINTTQPMEIETGKQTVLIIHGWMSDPKSIGLVKIRDAYITKYDYNIIMVDWSESAHKLYTHSYCVLPNIAEEIGKFLCLLNAQYNIAMEDIHLVGHSLGGQMSGLIGQNTIHTCNKKVEKITALDPAGPLYFGMPASSRLDASDAKFVQVIHTNAGVFGYLISCGHVDFFLNCGIHQSGCPFIDISNILDTLVSVVTCSHSRSQNYLAESIYTDNFVGKRCRGCPVTCLADAFSADYSVMGETISKDTRNSFLINTAFSPPYAKQCRSLTYAICL